MSAAHATTESNTLSSSTSWDERVAYYQHNRRMVRASGGGAGTAVTDDVDSLRFSYFDGEGASTADPAIVEQIRIRLYYSTPNGVQSGVIESQVALRNNIYAN